MGFAAAPPSPFSLPFLARSGCFKILIELKLVSLLVEVIPLVVLGDKLKKEYERYIRLREATYSTRSHLRRILGRYLNSREQYHDKAAEWLTRFGNGERVPLTKEDIAICRSFVWVSNSDLVEPIQTEEWIVLLRILGDILNAATKILLERMGERGFKQRSKQIKVELLCLAYGLLLQTYKAYDDGHFNFIGNDEFLMVPTPQRRTSEEDPGYVSG